MNQLLVNAPHGHQQLLDIEEGGGYFDASRVLWDTRIDGPLPEITLGGMVRDGASLIFDQARMDQHIAAVSPPKTAEQIIAEVTAATQKRLDDFARTRNYDGILSACTYATSSVPKFTAEGQYAVDARDNTWATLYAFMADVQAGLQPMPTGFADVEPFLPSLNWP